MRLSGIGDIKYTQKQTEKFSFTSGIDIDINFHFIAATINFKQLELQKKIPKAHVLTTELVWNTGTEHILTSRQ